MDSPVASLDMFVACIIAPESLGFSLRPEMGGSHQASAGPLSVERSVVVLSVQLQLLGVLSECEWDRNGNRTGESQGVRAVRVRGALHVRMAKQVEANAILRVPSCSGEVSKLIFDIFHVYKGPTLHLFAVCMAVWDLNVQCIVDVHGPRR